MLYDREPFRLRVDGAGRIWIERNSFRRELSFQDLQELIRSLGRAQCRQDWGRKTGAAANESIEPCVTFIQ